jgi:hypothetical protein
LIGRKSSNTKSKNTESKNNYGSTTDRVGKFCNRFHIAAGFLQLAAGMIVLII